MKKGMSPIVSVVLLIAIAVVAAIGIYFWMSGMATKQPTPETPIPIVANPISGRSVLITNLGNKPIITETLKTSDPSMVCDFGKSVTIKPGEQARCELKGFSKNKEIVIYGNGTGSTPVTITSQISQIDVKRFNLNGGTSNEVDLDGTGYFYIAGSYIPDTTRISTVVKTDTAGSLIWHADLSDGRFYDLIYHNDSAIYVTGYYGTSLTDPSANMSLARIDASGNVLWSKSFDVEGPDIGIDIASDDDGNAYPIGTANRTTWQNGETGKFVVIKVRPDGTEAWRVVWVNSSKPGSKTGGRAITYYNGYIYAAGDEYYNGKVNTLVMKINPDDGSILWAKVYNLTLNTQANGIVGKDGYLFISGREADNPNFVNSRAFVMKLDTDGNYISSNRWLSGSAVTAFGGLVSCGTYLCSSGLVRYSSGEEDSIVVEWDDNLNVVDSASLEYSNSSWSANGRYYNGYFYQAGTMSDGEGDILWITWKV